MRISDWSSDVGSSDLRPAGVEAGWSQWPAPAKLNLCLRVVGRRADGYHRLQTVFRILDWGDTIRLRPRADGVVARHGDAAPGVTEAGDLTVRAARLLQTESKKPQGVDIAVEKRITVGGGFGGGSSDDPPVWWSSALPGGVDLGGG